MSAKLSPFCALRVPRDARAGLAIGPVVTTHSTSRHWPWAAHVTVNGLQLWAHADTEDEARALLDGVVDDLRGNRTVLIQPKSRTDKPS